jgi:ATP-dependent Clp protease ATP-binding subunit ClpA
MWQRFTEHARRIIFYAQEEASRLGTNLVSTEHILLGLAREPDCTAVKILAAMGVSPYHIRTEIESRVIRGDEPPERDMQLTVRSKRAIDLAYSEAKSLDENSITSKHLLLGLVREGDGMAAQVLQKLGVDIDRARNEAANIQNNEITTTRPTYHTNIPAMRNEAQKILEKIIEEFGTSIYTEHERCINLLWERRGEYAREIMALQLILQAGIVEELVSSSDEDVSVIIDWLPHRATELTPIDERYAIWAIVSWAKALRIAQER